jgi:hypothetical protein
MPFTSLSSPIQDTATRNAARIEVSRRHLTGDAADPHGYGFHAEVDLAEFLSIAAHLMQTGQDREQVRSLEIECGYRSHERLLRWWDTTQDQGTDPSLVRRHFWELGHDAQARTVACSFF